MLNIASICIVLPSKCSNHAASSGNKIKFQSKSNDVYRVDS